MGMRERMGSPPRLPAKLSSMRPPRIAVLPLGTRITLSNSRERMIGTRFCWFTRASSGFGSFTSPILLVTVGRTLSTTMSVSLTWGVTFITKPTGTSCGVVLMVAGLVTAPLELMVAGVTSTVKYTRLSTTFSTAVWLLIAMMRGLESTRVLPNWSSSLMVLLIDPPEAALGLVYWIEKKGLAVLASVPVPLMKLCVKL